MTGGHQTRPVHCGAAPGHRPAEETPSLAGKRLPFTVPGRGLGSRRLLCPGSGLSLLAALHPAPASLDGAADRLALHLCLGYLRSSPPGRPV